MKTYTLLFESMSNCLWSPVLTISQFLTQCRVFHLVIGTKMTTLHHLTKPLFQYSPHSLQQKIKTIFVFPLPRGKFANLAWGVSFSILWSSQLVCHLPAISTFYAAKQHLTSTSILISLPQTQTACEGLKIQINSIYLLKIIIIIIKISLSPLVHLFYCHKCEHMPFN